MKFNLVSVTSVLVLVIVVVLFSQVKVPMCYNLPIEDKLPETFVLYPIEIIPIIQAQIKATPFHYIKIVGNSMQPNIKDGDTLRVPDFALAITRFALSRDRL